VNHDDPFEQNAQQQGQPVDAAGNEMGVGVHPEVFIAQLQQRTAQLLTGLLSENAELRAALQTVHADMKAAEARAEAMQGIIDELRTAGD